MSSLLEDKAETPERSVEIAEVAIFIIHIE